jgi:glycosyltransferase involved in cell wall biosynthesis
MHDDVELRKLILRSTDDTSNAKCLGVIIPVFNEVRTINELLRRVLAQPYVIEIIVVNDGSTDGTQELLRFWPERDGRVRVLEHPFNHGKGWAIRTALQAATAPIVIVQDADLEYNPADYWSMLKLILSDEADVVYGSRLSGRTNRFNSYWHVFGNRLLTWLSNLASGMELKDEATCYKMFRLNLLRQIVLNEDGFGFCPEITAKVSKLAVRIREVPISYCGRTVMGGKKIRLTDGLNAIRCIIQYNFFSCRTPLGLGRRKLRLLLGAQALIYAAGLLFTSGVLQWGHFYSISMPFRSQTDALLRGELALSHNPADLANDLCWAQGGVQQVWGLGIPLWRLPFELVAKLFGFEGFPDRLALVMFITVVAYVVLRTWYTPLVGNVGRRTSPSHSRGNCQVFLIALGAVGLSLFFGPMVSLLLSRMLVYEEVMVYVYFYGIALLCGIISLARQPRWWRFILLCGLAGLGGLVRPTLIFYGVATVVIAMLIMLVCKRTKHGVLGGKRLFAQPLVTGLLLFSLGGGLLLLTNRLRFGDGFEFGHRLNLQSDDFLPSVYSTRFDYPFARLSIASGLRELFGALFQIKELNGFDYYRQGFFEGQTPIFRWREFLFKTYDRFYAIGLSLAFLEGVWMCWKWRHSRNTVIDSFGEGQCEGPRITALLILWATLVSAALGAFYSDTPAIASRYMLDFAPAFVAALVGLWMGVIEEVAERKRSSKWLASLFCLTFIGWQGSDLLDRLINARSLCHSVSYEEMRIFHSQTREVNARIPLASVYQLDSPKNIVGIPFNGEGWDITNGNTKAAVELFVEDPQLLILDVAPRASPRAGPPDYDCIQAKIGLEFLERGVITAASGTARIVFKAPKGPEHKYGLQPVFLAMVRPEALSTNDSNFRLLRICWWR